MELCEFGQKLLETKDLDPVYVVLHETDFGINKMSKWLLAYWCFYHMGTASWICDGDYWKRFMEAASTKEHPRASERRHYRGQQAIKSVEALKAMNNQHSPLRIVYFIAGKNQHEDLEGVLKRAKTLRGFGEWISFKIADMLERLGIRDVEFTPRDVLGMFESPRQGAELAIEKYGPAPDDGRSPMLWVYDMIVDQLGEYDAPPRYERKINIQEVETILCKWKSHMNGHYKVGKDIIEVKEGLEKYQRKSETAKFLLKCGAEGGLW